MGYIKKLKNNELVGGTDKATVYPVTSTEAVFEEVSENNFESQKYLNNHIYGGEGGRINQESITNYNIAKGTLSEDRLDTALKTKVQEGYDTSWKFKGEYDKWATYDAHDVVYDTATNSSYLSLQADNQWHPVNPEDEAYVEGWWQVIMNGISAVQATEEIEATKNELIDYIQENLKDQVDDEIADAESRVAAAEQYTQGVLAEAEQTARSISGIVYQTVAATPNYTDTIPVQNKAVTAQIGYYTCSGGSGATIIVDDADAAAFTPVKGGHVKILMTEKSTVTSGNVQLQFGSVTATKKVLLYNDETVSSSNSWELGEVISVYYDGTRYHASNAQGGSNKKIDAYLLGGLRTLAVGETYSKDEAIKTSDKQLLRMSKPVETINLSEVVHKGSLYTDGTNTYEASDNITEFKPSTEYSSGDYALGSRSVVTIAVTAASTEGTISVTIGGTTADITASTNAETTAASIAALTVEGWTLAADGSNVIATCKTIGNNTLSVSYTDTDSTGATLTDTAVAGTSVIRKYNGSSWDNADVNTMVTDGIYVERDAVWLATNAAKQNTVIKDLSSVERKTLIPIENLYSPWDSSYNGNNYLTIGRSSLYNSIYFRKYKASAAIQHAVASINKTLVTGQKYNIKFEYSNTLGDGIYFSIRDSSKAGSGAGYLGLGTILSGTGTIDVDFIGNSSMYYLCISIPGNIPVTDNFSYLYNVTISKLEDIKDNTQTEIENIWNATGVRYYIPDIDIWHAGRPAGDSGDITADSGGFWCDLDVTGIKKVHLYVRAQLNTYFFDSNNTVIGKVAKTTAGYYDIAVPEGAAYMRHQCSTNNRRRYILFYIDNDINVESVTKKELNIEYGFIYSAGNYVGYNSPKTGEDYDFNYWRSSGLVKVKPATEYTIDTKVEAQYIRFYWYNENRTFISFTTVLHPSLGEDNYYHASAIAEGCYLRIVILYQTEYTPKAYINGILEDNYKAFLSGTPPTGSANNFLVTTYYQTLNSDIEETSEIQDVGYTLINRGLIKLPTNYDPDGEPSRLVIYCHGADGFKNWSDNTTYFDVDHIDPTLWVRSGYAVMDMDDLTRATYYNEQDVPTLHTQNCYKEGYEYALRNYNIKRDGVILCGRSLGGQRAMMLLNSQLPIICCCLIAPSCCFSRYWNMKGRRKAAALYNNFPTTIDIDGVETEINWGETTDITDVEWLAMQKYYRLVMNTHGILKLLCVTKSEFFATHIINGKEVSLRSNPDIWDEEVFTKWIGKTNVPIKVWYAKDDTTLPDPTRNQDLLYNIVNNGGGLCEYHIMATGGHFPERDGATVTYTNRYGVTYENASLVYAEMLQFIRRYEQD